MGDPRLSDPRYWDGLVASYESMGADGFTRHFALAAVATLDLGPSSRVLDVATGVGAAAAAVAAAAGAQVLAVDFSPGMVRRVQERRLPGVEARQMDGQALDLPDASFDAVISVFGVMMFPDWRGGLREMARVTRPGGAAAVVVMKDANGAGANLLLSQVCRALFPELALPVISEGVAALADRQRLADAMTAAGFDEPSTLEVTHDFHMKVAALDDPERTFGQILSWGSLDGDQKAAVGAELRLRTERGRVGDVLPIPSTALLATARRP